MVVPGTPELVLGWFLDGAKWLRFQGRRVDVEPRIGGRIRIDLGSDTIVAGEYLAIDPGVRATFTWGLVGDRRMPSGSSTVTVLVTPAGLDHTEVLLRHDGLPDAEAAAQHRSGWRYHLLRLRVVAGGAIGDEETIDLFLAAATEADVEARRGLLRRSCTDDVEVADPVGRTSGLAMLSDHFGRLSASIPPRALERRGPVRRIGAIVRAPYALVELPDRELEHGELIGATDRAGKLSALSLFE